MIGAAPTELWHHPLGSELVQLRNMLGEYGAILGRVLAAMSAGELARERDSFLRHAARRGPQFTSGRQLAVKLHTRLVELASRSLPVFIDVGGRDGALEAALWLMGGAVPSLATIRRALTSGAEPA